MVFSSVVRAVRIATVLGLVLVGLGAGGAAGASAASCGGSGAPSPNVGSHPNYFNAVAATSACNAWAVGYRFAGSADQGADQTLIERWRGKAWKVQKSPNASTIDNQLFGVAAVSTSDA
jgi:hypothetical protein